MQIEQQLRRFIVDSFLYGRDPGFSPDASLLETGTVDSTGMLELIAFLEETYGIAIEEAEMIPENLDSLRHLVAFVERKRSRQVAVAG